MKLLVGVKRVIDYAQTVRVAPDNLGVVLQNMKMSMNPFCEIAVEESIRLKEKNIASEVIAVSIGPNQAQETLRTALAMGADRAIHVNTSFRPDQEMSPLLTAKVFQQLVERETPDMVLMGKQSIDGDFNQTAQMLSGMLNWSLGTFLAELDVSEDKKQVQITRETDTGSEVLSLQLPSVLTCDLRLNTPRYPNIKNIMKAKKKKMDALELSELVSEEEVASLNQLTVSRVEEPAQKSEGLRVENVDELLAKLREKGVIA
jgi:electron transfer flavoprotein beta subunit